MTKQNNSRPPDFIYDGDSMYDQDCTMWYDKDMKFFVIKWMSRTSGKKLFQATFRPNDFYTLFGPMVVVSEELRKQGKWKPEAL